MKILCVSDEKDPLVYSQNIKERFKEIELVIGCGDLSIEYYEFIVTMLNKPLLFVYGNHNFAGFKYFKKNVKDPHEDYLDAINYKKEYYGSIYIDGKVKKEKGLLIAGLGGSMRYNKGEHQYTEFQMFLRILMLVPRLLWNKIIYKRYLDILVTHAPPKGIHDEKDICHRGFKVFLWFMQLFRPKYLIHGHVHIYDINQQRITKYQNTFVVNAYGHIVLDI